MMKKATITLALAANSVSAKFDRNQLIEKVCRDQRDPCYQETLADSYKTQMMANVVLSTIPHVDQNDQRLFTKAQNVQSLINWAECKDEDIFCDYDYRQIVAKTSL